MSEITSIQELENNKKLFSKLIKAGSNRFPKPGTRVDVTEEQGVYVIYKRDKMLDVDKVLHVGRTQKAKHGLNQRLQNHLDGGSSFVHIFLNKRGELGNNGSILREEEYSFRYLVVEDDRERTLLEAYATGQLCPAHLGTGAELRESK